MKACSPNGGKMDDKVTLILKKDDKLIVQMEIDEERVKATQAAALGLAQPRKKRGEFTATKPPKASKNA